MNNVKRPILKEIKEDHVLIFNKETNDSQYYNLQNPEEKLSLLDKYKTFDPSFISMILGDKYIVNLYHSLVSLKRDLSKIKHKNELEKVKRWADMHGHHSPEFLLRLLKEI